MLNTRKQLEYIYAIQVLENKIKKIRDYFDFIPILYKKNVEKLFKYKKKITNNKGIILKIKNNNIYLEKRIDIYIGLLKKYTKQKENISKYIDYKLLNKECEYSRLKLDFYKKNIEKNNISIEQIKNSVIRFSKKIIKIKKILKKKKKYYIFVLKILKNNIYRVKKILYFYEKKIKKYKIYRTYLQIKNTSSDKTGIVALYNRNVIEGVNLIIPKYFLYKINKNNKVLYDYYSGKIIISNRLSNIVNIKIKKIIKKNANKRLFNYFCKIVF